MPVECLSLTLVIEYKVCWLTPLAPSHRYKKNLKALYVVHATSFVRTAMTLLRPILRFACYHTWKLLLEVALGYGSSRGEGKYEKEIHARAERKERIQ